jgi:hypothetical protein
MRDPVRVSGLDNGAHATVSAEYAANHGLNVLKQPAVGRDGKPLPDKPKTTAKKAGSTTTTPSSDVTAASKEETS